MQPYAVVLADDHVAFREVVRNMLSGKKGLKIVGEASDGVELLNFLKVSKLMPDLAIIDISMPNLGGIETTRRINVTYPEVKVLILTGKAEKGYVDQAFSAGASGYLLKEAIGPELFPAIEVIRQGRIYIPSFYSEGST